MSNEVKLGPSELAEALDEANVSEGFRNDFRRLLGHVDARRNPDAAGDGDGDEHRQYPTNDEERRSQP